MMKKLLACAFMAAAACATSPVAMAAGCDRACLDGVAKGVLRSIERRDPGALPYAAEYRATQNNVPQAISMMSLWRTVTAVRNPFIALDDKAGQAFLVATVDEGPTQSLMYGRVAVDTTGHITEMEFNIDRSRGDAGFQYGLREPGLMAFPNPAWTDPVPGARPATRAELWTAGKSIFDGTVASPPPSEHCVMMENGQISNEDPEVLKYLLPSDVVDQKLKRDARGMDVVPCAVPPERPSDKKARVVVIDEQQGVVISTAMMNGIDQPYLVEKPTTSAFVPDDIMQPYLNVLAAQAKEGTYTAPRVKGWPVTASVTEMYRIYDGKIQGMMLLFNMQPYGSISPWVAR